MFYFSLKKADNWLVIINDIFQTSLTLYLIIILTEQFIAGFFSNYINLNIFLFIIIISGAIVLTEQKEEGAIKKTKYRKLHSFLLISLGIFSAELIFLRIIDLGWSGLIISIISGLIVSFISYIILTEK